jgi:hypothetical protein
MTAQPGRNTPGVKLGPDVQQREAPRVDERKATLAELERRRTECIALAEAEADPTMRAALVKRAAFGFTEQLGDAGDGEDVARCRHRQAARATRLARAPGQQFV